MMWLYQGLDMLVTLSDAVGLYIFSAFLCKEPRFRSAAYKFIMPGIVFAVTWFFTWHTEFGAYKMPIITVMEIALLKICYRDSINQCIVAYEFYFMALVDLTETVTTAWGSWVYGDDLLVLIDGVSLCRWEIYVIALVLRIVVLLAVYMMCRNFRYKIDLKDGAILTVIFLPGFVCFTTEVLGHLNLHKVADTALYISAAFLPMLFMLVFLYARNTLYLREQEQQNKVRISQMEQQFAYYQDKLKDEERVRSIYHDLKNHLLVLESGQNTEGTQQMAEKLRSEITSYEDYVHTGNEFLDIILKDKAEKARERQIDFSALVDFNGVDFIEPLDISTIFGNAIDNAIEASEKLPEDKRLITVKAERVRDMLLITIENNVLPGTAATEGTTKTDRFIHGFGLPNIKNAAGKYGGQCSIKAEGEKFTLKIIVPIL